MREAISPADVVDALADMYYIFSYRHHIRTDRGVLRSVQVTYQIP